jgi:outer membrane biosynthesis protein TonB
LSDPNNDKIIYSNGDIQRYINGQMSAIEMHALESAAMEDPFLADAIEGYTENQLLGQRGTADDLEALQQRLASRIKSLDQKEVIPLYTKSWLKVAAIILFAAGAGTLAYYISNSSRQYESIILKNQVQEPNADINDTSHGIISESMDTTSIAKNDPEKNVTVLLKSRKKITDKSESSEPSLSLKKPVPAPDLTKDEDRAKTVEDPISLPLAAPIAKANERDTEAGKSAVIMGYGSMKKKSDTNTAGMNEVAASRMIQSRIPGVQIKPAVIQEAMPVNGLAAFNRYIETNKKIPADSGNIHGAVTVSFFVSESGILTDYKIETSVSTQTDREALRLIKEGPPWKVLHNKKAKATVTINF